MVQFLSITETRDIINYFEFPLLKGESYFYG